MKEPRVGIWVELTKQTRKTQGESFLRGATVLPAQRPWGDQSHAGCTALTLPSWKLLMSPRISKGGTGCSTERFFFGLSQTMQLDPLCVGLRGQKHSGRRADTSKSFCQGRAAAWEGKAGVKSQLRIRSGFDSLLCVCVEGGGMQVDTQNKEKIEFCTIGGRGSHLESWEWEERHMDNFKKQLDFYSGEICLISGAKIHKLLTSAVRAQVYSYKAE